MYPDAWFVPDARNLMNIIVLRATNGYLARPPFQAILGYRQRDVLNQWLVVPRLSLNS